MGGQAVRGQNTPHAMQCGKYSLASSFYLCPQRQYTCSNFLFVSESDYSGYKKTEYHNQKQFWQPLKLQTETFSLKNSFSQYETPYSLTSLKTFFVPLEVAKSVSWVELGNELKWTKWVNNSNRSQVGLSRLSS